MGRVADEVEELLNARDSLARPIILSVFIKKFFIIMQTDFGSKVFFCCQLQKIKDEMGKVADEVEELLNARYVI